MYNTMNEGIGSNGHHAQTTVDDTPSRGYERLSFYNYIGKMTMRTSILFSSLIALFAFMQLSCDESITNNYGTGSTSSGTTTTDYTIVTDNPTSIITYANLTNYSKGTTMKLRVNRNGVDVWEVPVVFDGLYTVNPDRLILCHTNSDFPVGAGDSGSPLLTSDGRVAGILCYGYSGNSNDFVARAIEDVLSIDSLSVSSVFASTTFKKAQFVYVVSGYDAQAAARYPILGNILGQYTIQSSQPFVSGTACFTQSSNLLAKANALSQCTNNPVIPGSSIAVTYISGDYINEIAIGTMSYIGTGSMFAFGHSFQSFLAAPTYLASTASFIKSTGTSFKMSQPTTQFIGSFVKDDYNGILIKPNVNPSIASINTSCSINGTNVFSYNHQISNTQGFYNDFELAADLSCYLLYVRLSSMSKEGDSTKATCTLQLVTDQGTQNTTFILTDRYIDTDIFYYIVDNIQAPANSKNLKTMNLSMNLAY
jgi:hypothetical protein